MKRRVSFASIERSDNKKSRFLASLALRAAERVSKMSLGDTDAFKQRGGRVVVVFFSRLMKEKSDFERLSEVPRAGRRS
jgi:hypothetical protein